MAYVLMRTVSDNNGMIELVPCEPALQISVYRRANLHTNYYYLDEDNNEIYFMVEKGLYSIKDLVKGWKVVITTKHAFIFRCNYEQKVNKVFFILFQKHYSNRSIVNVFFNVLFLNQGLSKNARKRVLALLMTRPEMHCECYRLGHKEIFLKRNMHFCLRTRDEVAKGLLTTHDFFRYETSNS